VAKVESVKILKSKLEVISAWMFIRMKFGLHHHDFNKNWDLNVCRKYLRRFAKSTPILDAGSGANAVFSQLALNMKFENIYSIDYLDIKKKVRKKYPQLIHTKGTLEHIPHEDQKFGVIGCISVIEHLGSEKRVFDEFFRILKPGGIILITTDYWPNSIMTEDRYPYGMDMPKLKIYSHESIRRVFENASKSGFIFMDKMSDIETYLKNNHPKRKLIHWERMEISYTFLFFVK
jgi:ubiquinone/menaquinone biosynthesis C-methylase UbiE